MDLGTLGTDESRAIAINDHNQVLGTLKDKRRTYGFLWSEKEGLELLELPGLEGRRGCHYYSGNLKLNNRGQFCGYYTPQQPQQNIIHAQSFFWDRQHGFVRVVLPQGGYDVKAEFLNDEGTVAGSYLLPGKEKQPRCFLWKEGFTADLTAVFNAQWGNHWQLVRIAALSNNGDVAIVARPMDPKGNNWKRRIDPIDALMYRLEKSFIYKDGQFSMFCPGMGFTTNVVIIDMDDDQNIIVDVAELECVNPYHCAEHETRSLFFSNTYPFVASLQYGERQILGGVPQAKGHLAGKLKQDESGSAYFGSGPSIDRLIARSLPSHSDFYPWDRHSFSGQNSQGCVVGYASTLNDSHAYIAIPVEE
jgi:hypothetical protein